MSVQYLETPVSLSNQDGRTAAAAAADGSGMGAALRAIRRRHGHSLNTVARETGISPSFLSLVENGRSDITIGRLVRLVDFYDVSITDILPGESADPEVVREGDTRRLSSPAEGIEIFLLAPDTRRAMMPMLIAFQPGAQFAEYGRHAGEELVYVLDGRLRLELEGAEPRVLERGDGAYYSATRPHRFVNDDAARPLRVVCVDAPPNL